MFQAMKVLRSTRRLGKPFRTRAHVELQRPIKLMKNLSSSNATCTPRPLPDASSTSEKLSSQAFSLDEHKDCGWFEVSTNHIKHHASLYEPSDFVLYPKFLSLEDQMVMTDQLLAHLDSLSQTRTRRSLIGSKKKGSEKYLGFREEEDYCFESGHFDEVISGYREMQLSQFKTSKDNTPDQSRLFQDTISKLQALLPASTGPPLLHILHLSAAGKIEAHIDNIEASGSTIVGLSLGSTRVMRLGHQSCPVDSHLKVLLPPGSVYVQRDSVRYSLEHSIRSHDHFKGQKIPGLQRLSLMIRNSSLGAPR